MATPTKQPSRRLFLREHREAQGISAAEMGRRLGIERESVYRMEGKHWGMSSQKQAAYASALGLEPQELWRKPDNPSLDHIISRAPEDIQESVQKILRRLATQDK